MTPSCLNCLPKTPPANTITLRARVSTYTFLGGHKYSVPNSERDDEIRQGYLNSYHKCAQYARRFIYLFIFKFFFSTFIYFGDRERQSMNGGGAEREGDRESQAGSALPAHSPMWGSNS